jgi:hypothetical protein
MDVVGTPVADFCANSTAALLLSTMVERTVEILDPRVETDNPLDAFLREAQAFAPATIHDMPAVVEGRLLEHVSKESAEVRRRLLDLKQALERAIAKQSADLDRLTWIVRIAIYVLLALGLSQLGFIVWTRR